MSDRIPDGISRAHITKAIRKIEGGAPNRFAESTGYDVLFEGKRFAPKAVIGVAAAEILGEELGPNDFKGGLKSKCFRILENYGFEIITKGDTTPFPDEVDGDNYKAHYEGCLKVIKVNKYERDPDARKACIKHYGQRCQVCGFDFEEKYGTIGDGFIHVHHVVPISSIGKQYKVEPVKDMRPVCPNCHAMLHKRNPPFTLEELKLIIVDKS